MEDKHMNKCNCCGREVPDHEVATLQYQYGYFTERDGDTLNLKLCPDCLERFTQKMIESCKINPITAYEPSIEKFGFKCIYTNNEIIPLG
jgi:hypothetical protein